MPSFVPIPIDEWVDLSSVDGGRVRHTFALDTEFSGGTGSLGRPCGRQRRIGLLLPTQSRWSGPLGRSRPIRGGRAGVSGMRRCDAHSRRDPPSRSDPGDPGLPGAAVESTSRFGAGVRWNRAGDRLYFVEDDGEDRTLMELAVTVDGDRVELGEVTPLFSMKENRLREFDF